MIKSEKVNYEKDWVDDRRSRKAYREWVGPAHHYDANAAMQFCYATFLGLRENHSMLDIGCGSLRGGRLFISYLLPNKYCGVEPEKWVVEKAIQNEIGQDLINIKKPRFYHSDDLNLSTFGESFDFILAQGVFTHAPAIDIKKCLNNASMVMKKDAIFAANYFIGEEDYKEDKWLYPKISTFKPETMQAFADNANLASVPISLPHPFGANWIFFCHKSSKEILKQRVTLMSSFAESLSNCLFDGYGERTLEHNGLLTMKEPS